MERHTRSSEKDKKTRKARKRTLTGGSSENTGSRTSSSAPSSRERSASNSSRLSTKSGGSTSVKSVNKSSIASGKYPLVKLFPLSYPYNGKFKDSAKSCFMQL